MATAIINADRALSIFISTAWFPTIGKEGVLYFAQDVEETYRWDVNSGTYVLFASAIAGVTDHGLLTGLADDDHPQYALDTDLTAHVEAADPHPQYALDSDLTAKQPLDATLTAIADETLGAFSHRNKIINGNFDIWQRGTSQTTSGYGSDDRWKNSNSGTTKTHSQQAFVVGQTDVPGEPAFFSRTEVTSVAGAANFCAKQQWIEGVRTLAGKSVTVSFYAKADAAKNIAIEFAQNFGTGGTPSASVTAIGSQLIALTATWQKFTKTISIPSISGKTLGTNGDDNLPLVFWFDAGTDFNTRSASLGQQSGTFDIAQVQIEEGSIATPFEQRPIGYELTLCRRYYLNTRAGLRFTAAAASIYGSAHVNFNTVMRADPTLTPASGGLRANVSSIDTNADISVYGFRFQILSTAAGDCYALNEIITASAEL